MVTVVNAIVNRHQQRGRRKEGEPQNSQSPETEPNYKAICRQLTQKTQQLGKAYKTIEAQYDELKESCQDKDEQLNQAQQDADEMADLVRQSEERVAAYKEEITEKDERINALEQQLRATQNPKVPSTANQEASAKVDRNDLAEIHRRYTAVLSTLQEKKCTLTNAYRPAGTARSTISDFLGVAELKIVNEVTFESTLERMGNPKLAVKTIEQECRKQLGGPLPVVKRLRLTRKLLPLAQDNAFHS